MNHEDVRLEDEFRSLVIIWRRKWGTDSKQKERKNKSPRMEVIIVHMSVTMVMGKEPIRRSDLHELRCSENLRGISLKSRLDGKNSVGYSDLIVIQHYGEA